MDIVRVNTSGNDALQESGPDAWIVAVNTQLVTDNALHPQLPTSVNVRNEPTHTTVEHHEIGT